MPRHLPLRLPPVHDAPAAGLLARRRELDGTPRAVLDETAALSTVFATLRADFRLSELYAYRPEPPLDCPVSVFGGTTAKLRKAS